MEQLQQVKQRFNIIGNDVKLNRAIEKAIRVAPTDISVLVTGESGVGKENIPKIIHSQSHRKHNKYIAVNCGAIPEGTIDSELFGHEKGSFTGATSSRNGYFEEVDGGTIFLDEVGELPLTTQVRLLRVLENGEYLKVGSSKVEKTNVRIVAATNVQMQEAIKKEKFREDLYYRLSTVEIHLPPLRERQEDIHLLFRKFAADFGHKYKMPSIKLTDEAVKILNKYRWAGNIRQLRNIAEQISVIEKKRIIDEERILEYLPKPNISYLPSTIPPPKEDASKFDLKNEKEILYKFLFEMKSDLNDLKNLTLKLMQENNKEDVKKDNAQLIQKIYGDKEDTTLEEDPIVELIHTKKKVNKAKSQKPKIKEYSEDNIPLSLQKNEFELIVKALNRNQGKRKLAAQELGISERTLYRKLKQYNLD